MRVQINGLDSLSSRLHDLARNQLPFALSKTLNAVANDIKLSEKKEMERVFDRPTPYMLNSIQIKPSSKRNLVARIAMIMPGRDIGTNAPSAARAQVVGGSRRIKGTEAHLIAAGILPANKYLMPARGAKRDMYGNVPASEYVRILSDLQAFQETSFKRSAKMNKSMQSSLRRARQYYVKEANGIKIGIYKRIGSLGSGNKWSTVRDIPIFWFGSKPSYTKRLYFHEIARETAIRQFKSRFGEAFQYALKTAR